MMPPGEWVGAGDASNLTQIIPRVVGLMQGETWVSYEKCAVCRGLCLEWIDDEKAGADSP